MKWFQVGYTEGSMQACDTFALTSSDLTAESDAAEPAQRRLRPAG